MRPRTLIALCVAFASLAADKPLPPLPPPKPVTKPATRPAPERIRESLVNGSIRYLIPKDWEPIEKAENGMQARYVPNNHPRLRQRLVQYLHEMAEKDVKTRGAELVEGPKEEKDARFLARVRVRLKDGGKVQDSVHIYRGLGINLLSVNAVASTENPAEVKAVHDAGALMLLSVTTGAPDRKN